MYSLTPTEEVQCFLSLLDSGQAPSAAAKQAGLNPHEAILIRKLAGLPVNSHQQNIPEQVVNLRSQGLTHKQIAQQLGISQSYVNLCLVRHRKTLIR
ncbi:helix-turn-helix domain-containing protein [Pantoea agglomerans]|uniref:helix-turn-helix domain-containing protein n=1 Tax=Enterobacter agglomerans TaxID=549 RepID=UPI00263B5DA4|nr:hypothetical protein [Pantoea agglomerans]MDN4624236.1 hypothetical protein [Pantoea agglomerans]